MDLQELKELLQQKGQEHSLETTSIRQIKVTNYVSVVGVKEGDILTVIAYEKDLRGRNGYWCEALTSTGYALIFEDECSIFR